MEDDRRRWDERWSSHGPPEPRAPDALADRPDLLSLVPDAGRLLDVACGPGAVSLWAATRGLAVVALDVSPVAIDLLRAAARATHVTVDARVADLDHGLPTGLGRFDVVVCQRYRDARLHRALVEATAPGGLVVVTVLSEVGAPSPGPFHAPAGELRQTFARPELAVLHDVEAAGVASLVARRADPARNGAATTWRLGDTG